MILNSYTKHNNTFPKVIFYLFLIRLCDFLQVFLSFLLHFAPMRNRLLYLQVINIKTLPLLLS